MGKSTSVSIRIEEDVKKQWDALLASAGLNMSTAVNAFARQCIIENKIPFEIKFEAPNEITRKTIEDARLGKNLSKAYDNLETMWSELDADD